MSARNLELWSLQNLCCVCMNADCVQCRVRMVSATWHCFLVDFFDVIDIVIFLNKFNFIYTCHCYQRQPSVELIADNKIHMYLKFDKINVSPGSCNILHACVVLGNGILFLYMPWYIYSGVLKLCWEEAYLIPHGGLFGTWQWNMHVRRYSFR